MILHRILIAIENRGFITVHGLNKDRDEVKREGEKKENPSKSL